MNGTSRKRPESLKSRRVALGLELRDVAERVGASASTISRIERGLVRPSFTLAAALRRELGLTEAQFRRLWEEAREARTRKGHPLSTGGH